MEIEPDLVAPFEWIEEGKPYREFLVPAAVLNTQGLVRSPTVKEERDYLG